MVGPDLDHVPIDPFTGVPFRYLRDGLGIPLGWRQFAYNEFASGVIAAKVPFIWSAGERIVYKGYGKQDEDFLYDYRINDHFWSDTRDLRRADSEYDVWEAGWPFPVP